MKTLKPMRNGVIVALGLLTLMLTVSLGQGPEAAPSGVMGVVQEAALRDSLIGRWTGQIGRVTLVMTFDPNSRVRVNGQVPYDGQFEIRKGQLVLADAGREDHYTFDVSADTLSLSGSDLMGTVTWHRSLQLDKRSLWKNRFSWQFLKTQGYRLSFIVIVIVVCRLFLWLLRGLFHVLIYSKRGPLKYIYRYHKSRTMTIYSIILNASKYLVYVVAIGFVLNELGINYTTYLASLSVVGLAIGFGSQGLVQDMVTGFFIIFEDQFNVGDMVEINKNVGVVEELGLRMTRIKNYQDQRVVIPNRNISIVGNYARRALSVHVDVAVGDDSTFERLSQAMAHVAGEIRQQFEKIVLDVPKSVTRVQLDTGESFARLDLSIWPGQQWVIDQQLVPRLLAHCEAHTIQVALDQVVVFYGSGRVRSVRTLKRLKT
ncbi:MAG: mechanosensitive ion channel family protein [Planctomycetes bacterium]|nr:mechanosensitive ion channel family protein [Planctomycetota bacterium]